MSVLLSLWHCLVSSAHFRILLTMLKYRSLIHMKISNGPSTLPCSTPNVFRAQMLNSDQWNPVSYVQLTSYRSYKHYFCYQSLMWYCTCQMLFANKGRQDALLCCCLYHICYSLGLRNRLSLWWVTYLFLNTCWELSIRLFTSKYVISMSLTILHTLHAYYWSQAYWTVISRYFSTSV